ncbi:hypothetical protein [Litoribacillus peritrichatus]|uniref:Uncharacterized protein n=1 Tax=Litoribacillus peritrichatus TaxID=718191 RepID=A0ABP7MRI7_9GAMM
MTYFTLVSERNELTMEKAESTLSELVLPEQIRPVFDEFHQQYITSREELELQLIHLSDQGSIRAFEIEIILDVISSPDSTALDLKRINGWIGPHLKVDL